jgi:predicted  nucleic acid-binding Zn-ribbon protein
MEAVNELLKSRNSDEWMKEILKSNNQQQLSELASALQLQINSRRNRLTELSEQLSKSVPHARQEMQSIKFDAELLDKSLEDHLARFKQISDSDGPVFELERLESLRERISKVSAYLTHLKSFQEQSESISQLFNSPDPDLVQIANQLSQLKEQQQEGEIKIPGAFEKIHKFEQELQFALVRSLRDVSTTTKQ